MTFLPIVERELRVAARKRTTVWLRVLAALIALLIGGGFLVMSMALGTRMAGFGSGLFATLTWLLLAATLATGLFFTADCLSEEKRDGTLGFLFLTDLRGYDVVGGKLLATSLKGCYALLAVFPVLALTLLMGGVTGLQFWRGALALVNALFCSLAAGLLISSISRDSQRAMAGTFMLLLLLCAGGPLTDLIVSLAKRSAFHPVLSLTSPVYVFWAARAWGRVNYWSGLVGTQVVAWVCFAAACVLVPRTWQDRPQRFRGSGRESGYGLRYGGPSARIRRRTRLLDPNPVVWLILRERWQTCAVWVLAGLVFLPFGAILAVLPWSLWIGWSYQLSWILLLVLYLWTASLASRFFVDARRSGLLELLLVTPLSGRAIVAGHGLALWRLFGLPVTAILLVQLAGAIVSQHRAFGVVSASTGASTGMWITTIFAAGLGILTRAANLVALVWFGMWMGLTTKNSSIAALKTLLFAQILPWFAITFVSTSLTGLFMFSRVIKTGPSSSTVVLSFPLILGASSAVLTLVKDWAFIVWSRKRLHASFRFEASRGKVAGWNAAAPGAMPAPPVIAAS